MKYEYDVALSYAREDRKYVEKVAKILDSNGIKVFYDKFEITDIWGKDLAVHFDFVYRKSAKYCILFISEHYSKKVWTRHEIRSALSKALESNEEYILPARFDDTEIDGIRPTIGFIDLRDFEPSQFAELVIQKVKNEPSKPLTQSSGNPKAVIHLSLNYNLSSFGLDSSAIFIVQITNLNKEYRYFYEPQFIFSHSYKGADAMYLRDRISETKFPAKLEYGQENKITYIIQPESLMIWKELPKKATIKAVVYTTTKESFESNSIDVANIIKVLTQKGFDT